MTSFNYVHFSIKILLDCVGKHTRNIYNKTAFYYFSLHTQSWLPELYIPVT